MPAYAIGLSPHLYPEIMDIMPLLNKLTRVDPDHFVWAPPRVRGPVQNDSPFVILFSGTGKVAEIFKEDPEADLDYLDEMDLVYGLSKVALESGMRILFWEEKDAHSSWFFARVWRPNEKSHSPKEVKARYLFQALCLAYLANFE